MATSMIEDKALISSLFTQKEEDKQQLNVLLESTVTSNKPRANRNETVRIIDALTRDSLRPSPSNLFGNGPMLVSDIPESAFQEGVNMGIDEAGRGPVLGPMTYAAAFWAKSQDGKVPSGFNDSKQLTAQSRESLYQKIMDTNEMGFVLRILHATEISRNMLRKEPYNLNAMSHDAAMQMIRAVLDAGVKIHNCYVDTVGSPEAYQSRLNRVFAEHEINFVVEKKADSKYAECSAGSIGTTES
jgi:ribonuclease H2 subunit A